jgi:hypothetical protein
MLPFVRHKKLTDDTVASSIDRCHRLVLSFRATFNCLKLDEYLDVVQSFLNPN